MRVYQSTTPWEKILDIMSPEILASCAKCGYTHNLADLRIAQPDLANGAQIQVHMKEIICLFKLRWCIRDNSYFSIVSRQRTKSIIRRARAHVHGVGYFWKHVPTVSGSSHIKKALGSTYT